MPHREYCLCPLQTPISKWCLAIKWVGEIIWGIVRNTSVNTPQMCQNTGYLDLI